MRYFKDRAEAGQLLAEKMKDYAGVNCAVLALSEGGAVIGAEIAKQLHASLFLLPMEDIILPRELEPLASMSAAGTFTYNHSLSAADLEEITIESRAVIDMIKLETFQKLNRVISKDGPIDKQLLKRHVVIIVSDGLSSGLSLDVVADFLKPITTTGLIVASPLCSPPVIDRIHTMTTDMHYLDVVDSGFPLSHYYSDNTIPDHASVVELMQNISLEW